MQMPDISQDGQAGVQDEIEITLEMNKGGGQIVQDHCGPMGLGMASTIAREVFQEMLGISYRSCRQRKLPARPGPRTDSCI